MNPEKHISVVIANYNGETTIRKCLEALFSSNYRNFEVVVVDDHSKDNSVDIIRKFPCKLICLDKRTGAAEARNIGAGHSSGDIIFFTDADCLVRENTLSIINRDFPAADPDIIMGGTYTKIPHDKGFFSLFQSVFINYSETRKPDAPDYIATHAMVIHADTFRENSGFTRDFLPILEDVEFSHRLKKAGRRLVMVPDIQVQHIFNYSLAGSLRNAVRKSMYWTMYSLKNRDLFADSGTASAELKTNAVSYFVSLLFLGLWLISEIPVFLYVLLFIFLLNGFVNRGLLKAFYKAKGTAFTGLASIYYLLFYPIPVGTGVISGIIGFLSNRRRL